MLGEKYYELWRNQLREKLNRLLDFIMEGKLSGSVTVYLYHDDGFFYNVLSKQKDCVEKIDKQNLSTILEKYHHKIAVEEDTDQKNQIAAVAIYNQEKEILSSEEIHQVEEILNYILEFIRWEVKTFQENTQEYNNKLILATLYRALNRQYSKEKAVNVVTNYIYKKWGYKAIYLDVNEEQQMMVSKYTSGDSHLLSSPIVFRIEKSMDIYKKILVISEKKDMQNYFPNIGGFLPMTKALMSGPVYSQSKLVGLLIILYYDSNRHTSHFMKFKEILNHIVRELTAVLSRIERHNLSLEKMFGLTALENILLYHVDEDMNFDEIIQRIVSIIPEATGIKKCTIALIDENEQYLLPHYSTFEPYEKAKERKYPLDRNLTKDHTAILALETKKPVVVYDALTDLRCDPELAKELGVYSNITLPILDIHGKALGVMYIDNGEYEIFSKEQIRFFEIIARHLGLVISNIGYIGNLQFKSKYDGLTGLFNRETFETVYDKLYNSLRNDDRKFSILMLDIDNFKDTNDTYGHQIGDIILKQVAECIKANLRKKDIVARYGGEEVIILLKDIGRDEATIIANRILNSISRISIDGVSVTASIGIAAFKEDSYDKNKLIRIADECLYEAKRAGKNCVKFKNGR